MPMGNKIIKPDIFVASCGTNKPIKMVLQSEWTDMLNYCVWMNKWNGMGFSQKKKKKRNGMG